MEYESYKLGQQRTKLNVSLYEIINSLYGRGFSSNFGFEQTCDNLISELENIFNNNSPEQINQILGGEFSSLGGTFQIGKFIIHCGLPLYAMLSLIKKSINKIFFQDSKDAENRLTALIEKAKKLEYSEVFKPGEKIYEETLEQIRKSQTCHISLATKENIQHLSVDSIETIENGYFSHGEYIPEESKSISRIGPLYAVDNYEIGKIRLDRSKKNLQKLKEVAGKYFKSDFIPNTIQFHGQLISSELDKRIVSLLFSISSVKDKFAFEFEADYKVADRTISDVMQLEKLEQIIEQERIAKEEAQKKSSIKEAKKRYNKKSFFWKFFNKKLNPKNIDFDNMNENEIDQLYVGKVK